MDRLSIGHRSDGAKSVPVRTMLLPVRTVQASLAQDVSNTFAVQKYRRTSRICGHAFCGA